MEQPLPFSPLEHDDGSKTANCCLCGSLEQQTNPYPLRTVDIAAPDLPSDVSQEEPVAMEEKFMEKLHGWMMVLASHFTSMTFPAGLNPPRVILA